MPSHQRLPCHRRGEAPARIGRSRFGAASRTGLARAVSCVAALAVGLGAPGALGAPSAPGSPGAPGAPGAPGSAATPLRLTGAVSLAGAASAPGGYALPVPGRLVVINPFRAPPNPYSAGHRGVDLALAPAGEVFAAGPGTVSFAGQVAGRGVVVISHPDGIRTEYEPVTALVGSGDTVRRGDRIAVLAGVHAGCPVSCLHWGARRDGHYFDPLSLLTPLGPVRLMPCQARGWAC